MDTEAAGLHRLSSHVNLGLQHNSEVSVVGTLVHRGNVAQVTAEEAADLLAYLEVHETAAAAALRRTCGCVAGRAKCGAREDTFAGRAKCDARKDTFADTAFPRQPLAELRYGAHELGRADHILWRGGAPLEAETRARRRR